MHGKGSEAGRTRNAVRLPIRSRWAGVLLVIAGPVVIATLLIASYVRFGDAIDDFRLWILALGFAVMAIAKVIDIGRRVQEPDGWDLMRRDPRPPVIYLRSFVEDRRVTSKEPLGRREGGAAVTSVRTKPASREPRLAHAFQSIGPFVAVGAPGERLAPIGAARIYLSDDTWQTTVATLVERAAVVVLQPEVTPGTWWELHLVIDTVDLRRVLLLVPNPALRPLGYERVHSLTSQVLPVPLPEHPAACDAFMFDDERRPQPLTFGRTPARALQPFVAQVRRVTGGVPVTA